MNLSHHGLPALDWVALSLIPGVGAARLARLWTYLSSLSSQEDTQVKILFSEQASILEQVDFLVLRALGWPEHAAQAAMRFLSKGTLPYEAENCLEATLRWLSCPDQNIIFRNTPHYPALLDQIAVAPTFLYIKGNMQAWEKPAIGIVGARQASGYGKKVALTWGQQLAESGFLVVSGGARGIDTYAHQGALNASSATVAVMGTGLLNLYPRQNLRLFDSIIEHNGAIVSEYSLMTEVRPNLFPPRNRIISGMSAGVLVVEASEKSGSLISARYALEENREVFALPGRVGDPQANGTNQLIRQGATLVMSPEDILAELPRELRHPPLHKSTLRCPNTAEHNAAEGNVQGLSSAAHSLLALLGAERIAMDFDTLVRATGLAASDLSQSLMELELSGLIINAQGQYQFAP